MSISLKNVCLSLHERSEELRNFNLDVEGVHALVGASGSGKSNVLKVICGLVIIDEGDVYLDDNEVSYCLPRRRNVSVISDFTMPPNRRNALAVVAYPLRLRKRPRLVAVEKLKELGIPEDECFGNLSGYDRLRLLFARATVTGKTNILLDDVESFVTPEQWREISRTFEGLSVLYTTYDPRYVLGSHTLLRYGRIVPPTDIYYTKYMEQVDD